MTTQINIRLDKHLVQEIDALARMLHVPRSEWVRFNKNKNS
jgi:metal-responsive CopG/Arc/MetJ family transcriptional regulator